MITVFNRREVAAVFGTQEQAAIRSALVAEGIPYKVKCVSQTGTNVFGRLTCGSYGQVDEQDLEYVVYVQKKDYEWAKGTLRTR